MAIPASTLALIAQAARILAAAAPLFQSKEPTAAEMEVLLDEVAASRLARDEALDELRDVIDQMPD